MIRIGFVISFNPELRYFTSDRFWSNWRYPLPPVAASKADYRWY